jgi:tetratricopeptide (TPR) repeat protein
MNARRIVPSAVVGSASPAATRTSVRIAGAALIALLSQSLMEKPSHATLPSDCIQSEYPLRVIPGCTEVLTGSPNDALVYFKRGKAYLEARTDARDLHLAIADLTQAIELNPNYAEAYHQRGIAFRRYGDLTSALADQSKVIEIDPAFARAYARRGDAHHLRKDAVRALADYDKAIELDPAYPVAYFNRALVHAVQGDTDRAASDLEQAFKLGGRDLDYVLYAPGQAEQARIILTQRIGRDPADAAAYYVRGLLYAASDERERAIADFTKAIEIDSGYADAYLARGRAYWSERFDDARALADYDKAIALAPKGPRAHVARGIFYFDQIPNQITRALADYNKAIEFDPAHGEAYIHRGLLYAFNGEPARAKADFAKVLEIDWRLWPAIKVLYPSYLDEIEAERRTRP